MSCRGGLTPNKNSSKLKRGRSGKTQFDENGE
jgi:hypothetical protein